MGTGDKTVWGGRWVQNVRCHREVRGSKDRDMEIGFDECRLQAAWREKVEGRTWLQMGWAACGEGIGSSRAKSSFYEVWAVKTDRQIA